ncbi:isochorismate synthase [Janibacter sp. G56]|uniref:isochorismate synthase n=1 Tax=Janibacter sp. G56 TaxID=3418717 RepID=UPI003CFE1344
MSTVPASEEASTPAFGGDPTALTHTPTLVARTVAVPVATLGSLLAALPADETPERLTSWVRRGEGLVGWGRVLVHESTGEGRFADAERWWHEIVGTAVVRDDVAVPGTGPVCFGSMAYSADSPAGGILVVPEIVLGRRGDTAWVTTMTTDSAVPPPWTPSEQPAPIAPGAVAFGDGPLSPAVWAGAVTEAVERITAGELDKVVLARSLEATAAEPIDLRWLLTRLADRYDTTWVFAVDGLVGATPEMLIRLERGLVTSRVLAGTIRRTGDDEHDLALAGSLARSSKDLEEHEYAVRSVADALGPHTLSMNVPEAPFVLHLSNVMHLATDVAGVVKDASTSLALAASLHPSAAVCGTPTPVADALIGELEHMDRGRYAGPVGWMDAAGDGEWGIALRCAAVSPGDPRRLTLYAGCGIVAGSDAEAEVAESDAKFLPVRDALGTD